MVREAWGRVHLHGEEARGGNRWLSGLWATIAIRGIISPIRRMRINFLSCMAGASSSHFLTLRPVSVPQMLFQRPSFGAVFDLALLFRSEFLAEPLPWAWAGVAGHD